MSYRKNKSQTLNLQSTVFSIVIADGQKKRTKERALYTRRYRELEKATKQLRDFEDVDEPAFRLWLQTALGDLMSACSQATLELSDLLYFISIVKQYAHFKKTSLREAYAIVIVARENGVDLSLCDGEVNQGEDEDPCGHSGHDTNCDEDDDFYQIVSELFEQSKGGTFSDHNFWQQKNNKTKIHAKDRTSKEYLKSVYRQLVRLLHPDTGAALSAEQADLWHEVQNAYAWGDIQRLENLLKKVTGDDKVAIDLKVIPISHIMELRRDIEKRLRTLKNRVSHARQKLAWEFGTIKKNKARLSAMKNSLKYELDSELRSIKSELSSAKRQIAAWEKPPAKKMQKSSRPKNMAPKTVAQRRSTRKDKLYDTWIFDK